MEFRPEFFKKRYPNRQARARGRSKFPDLFAEGLLLGEGVVIEDPVNVNDINVNGSFGKLVNSENKKQMDSKMYDSKLSVRLSVEPNYQPITEPYLSNAIKLDNSNIVVTPFIENSALCTEFGEIIPAETLIKNEDLKICEDPLSLQEVLNLNLFEAFFLCYALGALLVKWKDDKNMSIIDLWQYCIRSDQYFPHKYTAYHYYRCKGWVVKNGVTFGTDFVLYKEGPDFHHSSYAVKVVTPEQYSQMDPHLFVALNRELGRVKKELLICIIRAEDGIYVDTALPHAIHKFVVEECTFYWHHSTKGIMSDQSHSSSFDQAYS